MKEWLPAIEVTIRRSTFVSYEGHVRNHIVPKLGRLLLTSVTGRHLNAFYAGLLNGERNLRPASVRGIHATLHRAFRDAVRWRYIKVNPADSCDPPKVRVGDVEMQTWSPEQLATFLDHVGGDPLYPMWVLLATTGMRRGEALGLRWSDVDLDAGTLAVRQTLLAIGSELHFSQPKTARGRRVIALDERSVYILRRHALAKVGSGLVFTDPTGQPLNPALITKTFNRLVAEAGLPRIRLHDLRHTHATIALQAGVHPKIVSERLGHSTISLTLDVYSHAIPHMQKEAAQKIGRLVFGR